eukprot:TRINITY_DN2851_c2_g1_i1.p1 TRINITY_DN2851_c2_g1~~TRINITY_DN2851_c2_g1_i1.p1  ORF type:complete len:397 (-),score=99.39 TRINITY_DN2851_c2_g1_i1:95-1285(-)
MDSARVLKLVLQYVAENYPNALKSLEEEANVTYDEDDMPLGSELVTILNDYADLSLSALSPSDALNKELDQDLMTQGEEDYVNKLDYTLEGSAHNQASVLSLRFSSHDKPLFASGATDKTVRVFDSQTKEMLWEVQEHMAGVISLDFNPVYNNLLLTGSMDSSHNVFDIAKKIRIQRFQDHRKFVVRAKWSPDGKSFATAAYDRTICFYNSPDPETPDSFTLVKRLEFQGNVEAIDYSRDGNTLIASIRDDNYLNYINTETFKITRVNMNSNGDDHVSFTALDIAVSPSGNHILIATDKDRLILYRNGSEVQVRNFYGAFNDGLSQPRIAWHPSSKYIYATSQDRSIYVWDVVSQKVVHKLQGHTAIPRTIDIHPKHGMLLTGGFDKTVKLWSRDR